MAVPSWLAWLYFAAVQLIMLLATLVGFVVLIPFCLAQAWRPSVVPSIKDGTRHIDEWSWAPLNKVYGNPEDGVSGQTALIWINGVLSPYLPSANTSWRAWSWSAWRNSCDALKYVFAWANGPSATVTLFGKTIGFGWRPENGIKVPVL
jgi:hypothetical protein